MRDRHVVRLVSGRQPCARFSAVVKDDLLGEPQSQTFVEELAGGGDVACHEIDVIESPGRDTPWHVPLRLVLERCRNVWRRLESFRFPIQLDGVTVGRGNTIRGTMSLIVGPLADDVVLAEVADELLECRVVPNAKAQMTEP